MIELPARPAPNDAKPRFVDAGFSLDGAVGGSSVRVDRLGSRFAAEISFPLMEKEEADVFVSRLIRAKQQGLRLPWPLLGRSQGSPGLPLVDGAGQQGEAIDLKGLTNGYVFREGYWISIENADGRHYLHNVAAPLRVTGTTATVPIAPALRFPFADGASVHIAKPMIEGALQGEVFDWAIRVDHLYQIAFTLLEDE
jgi:hypothetical protein